jgi:hypothetical protein
MIFKLVEGFQGHHKVYMPKNFKSKNGIEVKCDNDNVQILISHFHSLYKSEVEVDATVLENLLQCDIAHELVQPQCILKLQMRSKASICKGRGDPQDPNNHCGISPKRDVSQNT